MSSSAYGVGYTAGTLLSKWLFGSNSDEAAQQQQQLQKQQMMDEIRRRQQEAERQHQAEEARRLAEMYDRLSATLKLRGLPQLQLKTSGSSSGGLQFKLRDSAQANTIPGLPGSNVTFDQHLSDLSSTNELHLKIRDSAQASGVPGSSGMPGGDSNAPDFNKMTPQQLADVAESFSKLPPGEQQRLIAAAQAQAQQQQPVMRGFQQTLDGKSDLTRLGSSSATPNAGNPSAPAAAGNESGAGPAQSTNVTPSTGEQFMPPGEIHDAPNGTTAPNVDFDRRNPGSDGNAVPGLQFKKSNDGASAAAAQTQPMGQPQPKPPSPQGGITFERPDSAAVDVSGAQGPLTLRPKDLKESAPKPSPATGASVSAVQYPPESDLKYLFPEADSKWPGPKDPNFPLLNPLREEARYQQEMKQWDDWATKTGLDWIRYGNQVRESGIPAYFANFLKTYDEQLVQRYAPELLDRYERDDNFRADVDLRMKYAGENTTMAYYQEIADAHKAGIQYYKDGIEKLATDGVLEKGMGLPDQLQRHPEFLPKVQAVAAAAGAKEDAELGKAHRDIDNLTNREYTPLFDFLKRQLAGESK